MVLDSVKRLLLVLTFVAVASTTVRLNKHLMHEGRFPFPVALAWLKMACASTITLALFGIRPGLFPTLSSLEGRELSALKWFLPIGCAGAVSFFASYWVYLYCSVTFSQFMKEGNVAITFMLSCLIGLQSLSPLRVLIVACVIGGAAMAVVGELHIAWTGFFIQLVAQLAECLYVVMGEAVIGGGGLRLDPLSFSLLSALSCLAALFVGLVATWSPLIPHAAALWWPHLLATVLLASALNFLLPYILKEISAMGFMLAGIVRDITLVAFSWAYAHEVVSSAQWCGFALSLTGVCAWSLLEASPDSSECGTRKQLKVPSERTLLRPALEQIKDGKP